MGRKRKRRSNKMKKRNRHKKNMNITGYLKIHSQHIYTDISIYFGFRHFLHVCTSE